MEAQLLRLWSLHPSYLDARGLVALWREGLLAQRVLKDETRGYRHHPQLKRFREAADPLAAIAFYLEAVWREANQRGYRFNSCKIFSAPPAERLPITRGQLRYEFDLLCDKLSSRDPEKWKELRDIENIEPHPLFYMIEGAVAEWEKPKAKRVASKKVTSKRAIQKRVTLNR
jgi:hypothetical protein